MTPGVAGHGRTCYQEFPLHAITHEIKETVMGLKSRAGLFTLLCGKDLSFPSSDAALSAWSTVPARSTRPFLRRCIDGKAPCDFDSGWDLLQRGSGWQRRSVPQAELRPRLSAPSCLRDEGHLLSAAAAVSSQGEVLQDQALPAEVLPQENVCPGRDRLRDARAGLLHPRGLATGLGSALTAIVCSILHVQPNHDALFVTVAY
jgi:hypothetical protein